MKLPVAFVFIGSFLLVSCTTQEIPNDHNIQIDTFSGKIVTMAQSGQALTWSVSEYAIPGSNAKFSIPNGWQIESTWSSFIQIKTDAEHFNTIWIRFPKNGEIPERESEISDFVWEIAKKSGYNADKLCDASRQVMSTRFSAKGNGILECKKGNDGISADLKYVFDYISKSTYVGRVFLTGNRDVPWFFVGGVVSEEMDWSMSKMQEPDMGKLKDFLSGITVMK